MVSRFFAKKYTIEDLNDQIIDNLANGIDRGNVKVLIIDDKEFPYLETLRSHHFNLTYHEDITDIFLVQNYDIILCDIDGIGTKLSKNFQGAHVIKEIKKLYPSKFVVAYSAQTFNADYNEFFNIADDFVRKDLSSEDWVDILDTTIDEMKNPIKIWREINKKLVDAGVSNQKMLVLESLYTKSLVKEQDYLSPIISKSDLPIDAVSILNSLVASLIFKMVIG